jgi:uncharacterized LabA/DUF88 family protein
MLSGPILDTKSRQAYAGRSGKDYFGPGRCIMMIDGTGLHYTLRALNADIDYRKLREMFVGDMQLVRAIYYALTAPVEEESGVRRLLDWLDYNGYVVRERPSREFTDANGSLIRRGSVSLQMAVDALEMTSIIDRLILFSGDVDLVPLVKAVQRRGVCVTAVSTLALKPPIIAKELRRQVDHFVDMRELLPLIQLDPV